MKIFKGGQPKKDFDDTDNCRWHLTTVKAMNFRDDIPLIPIDNFKNHYVLVFDLNSVQDETENCQYPELVGEPQRLEQSFTSDLEHANEIILLGVRMFLNTVDKFWVVGKII